MTLPALDGVTNFRELGGLPTQDGRRVKRRRLFRSSHWGHASDGDVETLASLGVGLVIDFRSDHDIALEGADRLPGGTRHVSLATVDPASGTDLRALVKKGDLEELRRHFGDGGARAYMVRGAEKLVTHRTETFARFLAELCTRDAPPALFHCSAGKDRAGWAASILLLALGVPEGHVVDHYLLSNTHYQPDRQSGWRPPTHPEISDLLGPLVGVEPEYARASIATATANWGSVPGYLRDGLGITDDQLEQLRENWLE